MKILHLCLACFYIDEYAYQENILPRINKEDGHDVRIIASTETYMDNTRYGYLEPSEYLTEYGVPIKRLPYKRVVNRFITHKIRAYSHLYGEIDAFSPDVIMMHDLAFWSVLDVIRYKKAHPEVKLYADTHTAAYNSGTNWLSLYVLHRIYYRFLIQKALPYLEKYFYTGDGERDFSIKNYGVPELLMEFYPLGGVLYPKVEYDAIRAKRREELGIKEDQRLYIHSGKLAKSKRTVELLKAFSSVEDASSRLVIIGSIPDELCDEIMHLIKSDERITFLGWKSGDELREYLCACDLYCQPGSVSATMQNSICCDCAVMAYPHPSYVNHLGIWENILWVKTQEDMATVFQSIAEHPEQLVNLKKNSHRCAEELLDYRKLAARLYEQ